MNYVSENEELSVAFFFSVKCISRNVYVNCIAFQREGVLSPSFCKWLSFMNTENCSYSFSPKHGIVTNGNTVSPISKTPESFF